MPIHWITVSRKGGVHMRTAQELVANLVLEDGEVRLFNWDGDAAASDSMIGILCLGVRQGDKLGIEFPETPRCGLAVYEEILSTDPDDDELAGTYYNPGMDDQVRKSAVEDGEFFPSDKIVSPGKS